MNSKLVIILVAILLALILTISDSNQWIPLAKQVPISQFPAIIKPIIEEIINNFKSVAIGGLIVVVIATTGLQTVFNTLVSVFHFLQTLIVKDNNQLSKQLQQIELDLKYNYDTSKYLKKLKKIIALQNTTSTLFFQKILLKSGKLNHKNTSYLKTKQAVSILTDYISEVTEKGQGNFGLK